MTCLTLPVAQKILRGISGYDIARWIRRLSGMIQRPSFIHGRQTHQVRAAVNPAPSHLRLLTAATQGRRT